MVLSKMFEEDVYSQGEGNNEKGTKEHGGSQVYLLANQGKIR